MAAGLILLAVLFAAFTWWFATGAVLCLGRRPAEWHGTTMLALAMPAFLALLAVWHLRDVATPMAALAGFVCGVTIWAWHEASFLFGHLTGPRREPCPNGTSTSERFRLAFLAMRDHELALLLTVGLLGAMSWNATNAVALKVFVVLWLCRIAAKLCIFEGVPGMAREMMPARLRYLQSYFGQGRPGLAFAFAVLSMGLATAWLGRGAVLATTSFEATAATLLASMTALALLEHVFMVLPVHDARLWAWAMRMSAKAPAPHPASEGVDNTIEWKEVRGRRLQGVALRARAVALKGRAT